MRAWFGIVFACLLLGCAPPAPELAAPEGVELTPVRPITRFEQQLRLWRVGAPNVPIRYDIAAYRMRYHVRTADGRDEIASGLLALPRGVTPRALVVYNHGTTATRSNVPSRLDFAGREAPMALVGAGYAVIAPDYLGLGDSEIRHPYLVADPQARAIVSMIEAARRIEGVPQGPVFLTGHSEGGHASLAAMRMLEANGETVLGAAPIAGAYDLDRISFEWVSRSARPIHAFYLAYIAWAYADYYHQPLDSVLTPESARHVQSLFDDRNATTRGIGRSLTQTVAEMLSPSFKRAAETGGSHWLIDALAQNSFDDWTPRAPIRFYYGAADTEVAPQESISAAETMAARGATTEAISVGDIGHEPSLFASVPLIVTWLDSLETAE